MLGAVGMAANGQGQAAASTQAGSAVSASELLDQYVGQYRDIGDSGQLNSVYLDGSALYEESERAPRQRLTLDAAAGQAADRFRMEVTPAHVVFLRDAAGQVSGLRFVLDRDGRTLLEEKRISMVGARLNLPRQYARQEAMLPMRDGVRLHAVILRPAHLEAGETLPFLIDRTPYGVDDEDSESINESKPELAQSGYIFVFQDVRGRYGSEGRFVMNRPIVSHNGKNDVDETTDARDTIDWLLRNVPGNNGRVGVYGVSYDGFLAMMAGIDAHPAVKAIAPEAPMTDVWMGDDFFHNGAFRETYGFDYVQQMEARRIDVPVDRKGDLFDYFLRRGNFAGEAKDAGMSGLPTAKAFLTQPAYTKFWQDMAVERDLAGVTVPVLEVGGYWDQEDMWGTQAEYAALKGHDPVFLALGPWNHDGWEGAARRLSTAFGTIEFGQATGTEFRKGMEAPFFEKYLKDRAGFDLADTASFRTGVNAWERYAEWPPKEGFAAERLYLEAGKRLSFEAPAVGAAGLGDVAASYVADPADPVPYRHRPIQSTYGGGSGWSTWLAEDQSFVTGRKDVATFTMPALDHGVTVTGDVVADLFAATTGSDADWVVKLIDEYPSDAAAPDTGYQLMVAEEIFRGRYRKSFERPEALTPNAVNEFRWSLHGLDHTFLKGHRILVEVQSSWFPLYDRNPQTFVPNIMTAPKGAYKAETMTIYGSARYPSHLEFSVAR
jgi:hypothetical protein